MRQPERPGQRGVAVEPGEASYVVALVPGEGRLGAAWLEATTGDFSVAEWAGPDCSSRLRDELEPYTDRIAMIGQVGVAGPVRLATARLYALLGDAQQAREHIALAEAIATLLADPQRAQSMGAAGRKSLDRRFSLAAAVAANEATYRAAYRRNTGRTIAD